MYMKNRQKSIEKLGFNNWFQKKIDPVKLADYQLARVIAVNKNNYIISNGTIDVLAEITGKLIFNADSMLDFPVVGDWVYTQFFNDQSFAIIYEIISRKTLLKRKTAGNKIEFQLIAANIDTAMIMQSLDADYNLRRLERYLVMINESNIDPVILLSKSDLCVPDEIEKKITAIGKLMPNIRIIAFSNRGLDWEKVKKLLVPGKTFCLIGSSGVGKTTLLNNLIREDLFETQPVRQKDGRGRHTTARRELIILENGAMIIDTPGMRELGIISMGSGIYDTFNEISELSLQCRYSDCSHTVEESCAVLAALIDGSISRERYQNYLKMKKESDYHELSYREKRWKDKQFGKLYKSVMKHKKNKSG
jgi:ribosome biogenesis GTPase